MSTEGNRAEGARTSSDQELRSVWMIAGIKLMVYSQIVHGHVDRIARAINVANARPNSQGVATVNPIFTWVRLAQRIPVRVHIDEAPSGVDLAAGMTATVQIDDPRGSPTK